MYNIKSGRKKKMCYNGGSLGVWVAPKTFIVKSNLNNNIELIPEFEYVYDDWLVNL
jgi:hypothetical protein